MPSPQTSGAANKDSRFEQTLRVAPLFVVAIVGLAVCLLIACGGTDLESPDDGDEDGIGCSSSGGYATGPFGYRKCGSSRVGYGYP